MSSTKEKLARILTREEEALSKAENRLDYLKQRDVEDVRLERQNKKVEDLEEEVKFVKDAHANAVMHEQKRKREAADNPEEDSSGSEADGGNESGEDSEVDEEVRDEGDSSGESQEDPDDSAEKPSEDGRASIGTAGATEKEVDEKESE